MGDSIEIDSSAVPGGIDSSAVPEGIDLDTQMMYERCYKAGFDQYHKWLIANHPDDAKEWHKKEQELQKQEEELKYISKFLVQSVPLQNLILNQHKEYLGLGYSPVKNV